MEEANRSSNMLHQISLERAEKFIPKTLRDNLFFFFYISTKPFTGKFLKIMDSVSPFSFDLKEDVEYRFVSTTASISCSEQI